MVRMVKVKVIAWRKIQPDDILKCAVAFCQIAA